ncbi:O-antigen ligase family protein [Micromonospora sp. BRA006-A]|nr:O-antigen ligase family protein [Micromonospora sp. BRA006-A]
MLGKPMRRTAGVAIALAAIFPIVYSLNRGLWIGLGIAAAYVALRPALRGRMVVLGGLALAVGLIGVLIVATPLGRTFDERLQNGHSDDIRTTLSQGAVTAANHSPILGYGGNRALIGSNRSIAIGKSEDCKQCGNRELGSNGQVWALLVGRAGSARSATTPSSSTASGATAATTARSASPARSCSSSCSSSSSPTVRWKRHSPTP